MGMLIRGLRKKETNDCSTEPRLRKRDKFLKLIRGSPRSKYETADDHKVPLSQPVPQEWAGEEVARLEAQATKLRRTIARRRSSMDNDGTAQIVAHYEQVLADLE